MVKLLKVIFLGIHSFMLNASPMGVSLLNVLTILKTFDLNDTGKFVFGEELLPLATPHCYQHIANQK